jgi:predicted phage terminase large subunit-like protein
MKLRPALDRLSRDEKVELLALLEERHRREEAKRVAEDRAGIVANCGTLYGFIQEFWYVLEPARPFKGGWALRAMCAHLEAVTRGELRFLMMNVPPGMMKSLLLVFWPAWEWGAQGMPHLQYLATSFSQPNVFRDNTKMRRLVESEKYQALWPIAWRDDQNAKSKFENTDNGFREGRTFVGMTGGRGDRVIVDDPHSVDGAESDADRQAAVTTFREGITDRMNDVAKSAIVIIMQRLHEQDVAGTVIDLDMGFVVLTLPMEFEAERTDEAGQVTGGPCRTYIDGKLFFEDPRTQDGELLFPERFPPVEVARLRKAKGAYAWAGQYQQHPSPRGGGMFQREWFSVVDKLPSAPDWTYCRAWDFAATEGAGDYTAGCKMAYSPSLGWFVVVGVVRGQLGPANVDKLLKSTADLDGPGVIQHLPKDPGAAGVSDNKAKVKLLVGHDVRSNRPTGSKAVRARPAASQADAGNISLLRGSWNEEFMDEICSFPVAKHDDQLDAFADAFNQLALTPLFSWHVGS